jgi:tRNA 2-thiouridine synthesizing protein E
MKTVEFKGKTYKVTTEGFLSDFKQWDEEFAEAMGPQVELHKGLTKEHWDVIHFIHDALEKNGKCPKVYDTCRAMRLSASGLKDLFPTGYLRGACKLAGITYKDGYVGHLWLMTSAEGIDVPLEKTYRVDVHGFLVDADEWDKQYAIRKAAEMKMPEELSIRHWQIIDFLRNNFFDKNEIATVYETCEANRISIEELECLFPDGYHRGAIKISGLKVK